MHGQQNIKSTIENNRLNLCYPPTTIYSTVIVKSNEVTELILIYFIIFDHPSLFAVLYCNSFIKKKDPILNVSTNIPSIYPFVLQAHVIKF